VQNGVKDTLKENSVAKNTQAYKVEQTVKDAQKAADSAVVSEAAGINTINNSDLNKDAVVSDAGKLGKAADEKQAETVNFNLDDAALQGLSKEGPANLAKLFNTSLAVANEGTENQNINTNPKNESKPVTTWDAVRQAAGAGDKSVKIKGNITASDNLNVIGNLTIEGVDGVTLSLGQNSIVNNGNLTLDITKDKLDDIKNYAISHTSDQTLEYIKHSQAVSQDSGWKMTDAAGNPVTDPYAAVESPKLDGYTATIKSTNAPGVTQGADGSEVQAKLKINPDAVVKDGELTDAYKNNGVTGIPENYETVVVYKKEAEKGSVTVKYIDDTADKTLETKDLSGEVGEKSDYSTAPTIEDYTDKGYKLVSDDYPKSGVTFTKEPQKYEVHLKHTYSPVTPDDHHDVDPNEVTKNVKETVHYTGAGDKTPNDNVQNATWTPSETDYKAVPSPKIDGYTPDKETVPSTPVTMDDINVTVTYTKNGKDIRNQKTLPSQQTVKFVDEDGKELHASDKSPVFNYEYSGDTYEKQTDKLISKGSWNADSHKFDIVDVPVIDGYYAVSGYTSPVVKGYHVIKVSEDSEDSVNVAPVTVNEKTKNYTVTVTYAPNGHIIPVDKDGNPIPGAATPEYKNDPNDPTKVLPNEPIPTVDGWKPTASNVTP